MALINTTTTGVLGSTFFGDGSGDLTVQKDGVTINKITSAPAFSAYQTSGTSIPNGTSTKVNFQTVEFNINSCYDTSTSKFTPNVSGYYLICSSMSMGGGTSGEVLIAIYKNGSAIRYLNEIIPTTTYTINGSSLVYANGTTDYFEIYTYQGSGGSKTTSASLSLTNFQAVLVRAG